MTPEQVEELQEKIKNMNPEELKEFQKKQCVFCHIIEGQVQSRKVYEDDKSIAILDINPCNPGHILLLPKEHYSIMPQLSEEEIAHLFMIAKTISNAVLRSLGVQGTNIIVQNGVAAGQKAQHFMIHIIPRKEGDDINFVLPQKKIPENELEKIRKKLEEKLGGGVVRYEPKQKVERLIKPKEHVVEAEFKKQEPAEKVVEPKKIVPEKKIETKKKKEVKKQEKKPMVTKKKKELKKNETEASLDDIARLIGAK